MKSSCKKAKLKKIKIPINEVNPTIYKGPLNLDHLFEIVFVSTADGIIAWAAKKDGPDIRAQANANHSILRVKPTWAHWSVVSGCGSILLLICSYMNDEKHLEPRTYYESKTIAKIPRKNLFSYI